MITKALLGAGLLASSLIAFASGAATLANGSARVDYDKAAWDALAANVAAPPVLALNAFFNQTEANAMTYDDVLHLAATNPASYTHQIYGMNTASVANLPFRTTQPTTFEYTPGDLTNHTGRIGLGGIARFTVSTGGQLLYGDFTLQYSATRHAYGGTGWHIRGNIPPAATAYDLLNVTITESSASFTITGDLCVSYEIANLLYSTPADTLRDVGDFTFTAQIAATNSAPVISSIGVSAASVMLQMVNGAAGTAYTVSSTTNINLPGASWELATNGVFASDGKATNSIPVDGAERSRFYRLQQP